MENPILTYILKQIALDEGVDEQTVRQGFDKGRVAVFKASPQGRAVAVGEGLRVKVNANIGTSPDLHDEDRELRKLEASIQAGADTVMDLSTGGDLRSIRRKIIKESAVPVGSVPIYEAIVGSMRNRGGGEKMEADEILDAIRLHGEDGISFVTVHSGVTLAVLDLLEKRPAYVES